jgi:hypothetical protein
VLELEVFVRELVAIDRLPAGSISLGEISTLERASSDQGLAGRAQSAE